MMFDFHGIEHCEFGVGLDTNAGERFVVVPASLQVQTALREIAENTNALMRNNDPHPARYEPGEKHAATEHLILPIGDPIAELASNLHHAINLDLVPNALQNISQIFCYFSRFVDHHGRRLTALRRSAQFKGVLSARGRLVRQFDDELVLVDDRVFRLDTDFDFMIDDNEVHIWRPSGFEFVGRIQQAILAAVPHIANGLRQDVAMVSWDSIEAYAATRPRAARYLASIRDFQNLNLITQESLVAECEITDVEIVEAEGQVSVREGHEMGFLEVLDRRRFQINLVPGQPENFRAPSRRRLE